MSDERPTFWVHGGNLSVKLDLLDSATHIREWESDPRLLSRVLEDLFDEIGSLKESGSLMDLPEWVEAPTPATGVDRDLSILFVRIQLQAVAVFQTLQPAAPVPTAELEHVFSLIMEGAEDSVLKRATLDLSCACIRFQLWAEVTHRGSNDDRELFITTTTIARIVGVENRNLNKTGWPEPVEEGAGRRPDKFNWREIRPALERLYPEAGWDDLEKNL